MTESLRVLIHGASGRMGRALLRLAAEDSRVHAVAAVSARGSVPPEADGVPVFPASRLAEVGEFDVAIDFSLPDGFDPMLALCRARRCALISGTTGLNPAQLVAMQTAAEDIAILWSANFSIGVAVLSELVRQAASAVPGWDIDIVESHHVHKKDAPSGTALHLGEIIRSVRARGPTYSSLRAGDIVGEHTVQLTGQGERLELVHRASNRDIFARGALEAACRLRGKPAGTYGLAQLLLSAVGR